MKISRLFCVIVVVLMSSGTARAAAARVSFDGLEQSFLAGRYEQAVAEADRLIDSRAYPRDEIYYLKGISELKLKKFEEARNSFNEIISKQPQSKRAFDAYLGTGDAYLLDGNTGEALGVYNTMLDKFASDKNLAVVHYRLADCYATMGLRDKSDQQLAMAKSRSPLSFEARTAKAAVISAPQAARTIPINAIVPSKPAVILKTPAAPAPADTQQGYASVQVGSFKSKSNAERLARKLSGRGYEARVEIPLESGDRFYRVKVGKVTSRSEAEALAARLQREGYKTRMCVDGVCE